jgi:type I restriction enzyme S subunit
MSGKATINFVSAEKVKGIKLTIPPLVLQQNFVSKIEAIEKQKELIKQSLSETETLFNSRMDYYFN